MDRATRRIWKLSPSPSHCPCVLALVLRALPSTTRDPESPIPVEITHWTAGCQRIQTTPGASSTSACHNRISQTCAEASEPTNVVTTQPTPPGWIPPPSRCRAVSTPAGLHPDLVRRTLSATEANPASPSRHLVRHPDRRAPLRAHEAPAWRRCQRRPQARVREHRERRVLQHAPARRRPLPDTDPQHLRYVPSAPPPLDPGRDADCF